MTNFSSPVRTQKGRVNLIPNPSFEYGTTVASTYTGSAVNAVAAVNTSPANAMRGTNSVQLTGTGVGVAFLPAYGPGVAGAPVVSVLPSTTYSFSFWVKCTQVARTWAGTIFYLDASGAQVGQSTGSQTATSTTGFTQVSVTATSTATTTQASFRMVSGSNSGTEVYYIDGLLLEPGATPSTTHFDGTFDSGRWVGTAHNSASESYGIDANGGIVQGVASPVLSTDAANRAYVDSLAMMNLMGVY